MDRRLAELLATPSPRSRRAVGIAALDEKRLIRFAWEAAIRLGREKLVVSHCIGWRFIDKEGEEWG